MRKIFVGMMCIFVLFGLALGQDTQGGEESDQSTGALIPGATLAAPTFDARVSVGFNYDLLKSPTRVSFDYPRGYIGLNIPLRYGLDKNMTEQITEGLADMWEQGDEFEPTASARQNANTTVRVDVPMLGGVGTFSNVQNFYTKYSNTLGEPKVLINPDIDSINLMMQGMIAVPLDVALGWETMTFGYAYKVNDLLKFGINLHRHIFRFDLAAKIDIDLLGYLELDLPSVSTGSSQVDEIAQGVADDLLAGLGKQWVNYVVAGEAKGHYEVEAWSPTFAVNLWRFGLTSRIGVNTRAPGYLSAKYVIPFFVNPETFATDDLTDPDYLMTNLERFLNGETDSIEYVSKSNLLWKMPHGHTITFDIVKEKLWFSYTKIFGEIQMRLDNIATVRVPQGAGAAAEDTVQETVDFDVGVSVDHILMIHGLFQNAFLNLGIFSMDFRYGDRDNLLEQVYPVIYGGGALLPVLNFGTTFGSKIKLLVELDVLPLSALKTGVIYYF